VIAGRPIPGGQRGVALITAMLILALIGTLALTLSFNNAFDLRRTMTMIYHDEGTQAAYGAESWVAIILQEDARDSQTDHLGEIWAQPFPALPIESDTVKGAITGELVDLQGRFNVNNLVDPNTGLVNELALQQFQRLLIVLEIDPRFAGIAADWLDADEDASFPDGAEDPIYSGMTPPYRTANHAIVSTTELMALEGMDKETFDRLAPFISALPGRTQLNVNTAPGPVLQALDENLSAADVEGMIAERADGGLTDIQSRFQATVAPEVLETLTETSSFFQLKVVVQIATVRVTYVSLLYRDSGAGDVVPIMRSFGTV
jgi:general secretion pathway protein K